jgi:hypothetical protein
LITVTNRAIGVERLKSDGSWSDETEKNFGDYLDVEVNMIFREVRNLLLLDPSSHLCPFFGSSKGNQQLRNHPLLRHVVPSTFRGDLFSIAGVKPGEVTPIKDAQEHLSDIDASFIRNGPFRLALTDDPARHLRFDEGGPQPTILVLDSKTISKLALLDLAGFMKYDHLYNMLLIQPLEILGYLHSSQNFSHLTASCLDLHHPKPSLPLSKWSIALGNR